MDAKIHIQSHWTIDKVLKEKPSASAVFMNRNTQCVGCYMQKFCTVRDAAETYQLDLEVLVADLNECESENHNSRPRSTLS